MPPQSCPTSEQLTQFNAGTLGHGESEDIVAHLDECESCCQLLLPRDGESDPFILALRGDAPKLQFCHEKVAALALQKVCEIAREVSSSHSPVAESVSDVPESDTVAKLENLSEYRLLEPIGAGGMGTVYKARHMKLDRQVAVKVLPQRCMSDSTAIARFEREMRAVGRLNHPNIVGAMDAREVDGTHFLVMEFVPGTDLSNLVAECGPLPIPDACELIRQAAVGLQYAHENGLVHRDIKPSNLTLTRSAHDGSAVVKVLDLGLALLDDVHSLSRPEVTVSGQVMGTLDYMSPEQCLESHTVDARSDVYSLGATLYKLLVGEAPFGDRKYDSLGKKVAAILGTAPESVEKRRPETPAELSNLVDRMLLKDPKCRPATADDVASALRPFSVEHALGNAFSLDSATHQRAHPASRESGETVAGFSVDDTDQANPAITSGSLKSHTEEDSKKLWQSSESAGKRNLSIVAGIFAAALLLAGVIFFVKLGEKYDVQITVEYPDISLKVDGDTVEFTGVGSPVRLSAGAHKLLVKLDGFETETYEFTVKKDGKNALHVAMVDEKLCLLRDERRPAHVSNDNASEEGQARHESSNTGPRPASIGADDAEGSGNSKKPVGLAEAQESTSSPGGWMLRFGDRSVGVRGADFGFVARETPIQSDQDFTVEFWCRLGGGTRERTFWHPPFSFGVLQGQAVARHTPADKSLPMTQIVGPVITNRWIHYGMVVEDTEMRLYVNGDLSASAIISDRDDTWTDMPHFGFNTVGMIDEVRISNVARYGKETFSPEHRFVPDDCTLAIFHLDEGHGTDLIDASGNTVGTWATDSEGFARLKWIKADGPTAVESGSHQKPVRRPLDTGQEKGSIE